MRILSSQAAISLSSPFLFPCWSIKRNLGFQREIIICHHKRWKSRSVLQNRNSNFTEATLAPLFIAVSNFDCCVWSNVCGYIFFLSWGLFFASVAPTMNRCHAFVQLLLGSAVHLSVSPFFIDASLTWRRVASFLPEDLLLVVANLFFTSFFNKIALDWLWAKLKDRCKFNSSFGALEKVFSCSFATFLRVQSFFR